MASCPRDDTISGFSARLESSGQLVLSGELDVAASNPLRAVLDQAMLDPGDVISIDASGVTFIDTLGIGELLRYELIAAVNGRRLWLGSASPAVSRIIDLMELHHLLLPPETSQSV